jgi:hypothetical protein
MTPLSQTPQVGLVKLLYRNALLNAFRMIFDGCCCGKSCRKVK